MAESTYIPAPTFQASVTRKQLVAAGCDDVIFNKFTKLDIACAAVLEYIVAEVLELAGNCARDGKRIRVKQLDVYMAILNDEELTKVFIINDIHSRGDGDKTYEKEVRDTMKQVHPDAGFDASGIATMKKICAIFVAKMASALKEVPLSIDEGLEKTLNGEDIPVNVLMKDMVALHTTYDAMKIVCAKVLVGELVKHATSEYGKRV